MTRSRRSPTSRRRRSAPSPRGPPASAPVQNSGTSVGSAPKCPVARTSEPNLLSFGARPVAPTTELPTQLPDHGTRPLAARRFAEARRVTTVPQHLRRRGPVARRKDLLAAGFVDAEIRAAMRARRIVRVRHGWYAPADTPQPVLTAVRVGGMVTGVEALRLRGIFLPRPDRVDIAVPANAAALRSPTSPRRRLSPRDPVKVHWITRPRNHLSSSVWLASEDDALDLILRTATRELAVAACDGLVRYRGWGRARVDAAFARAPHRTQAWRRLIDGRSDSWGETALRLRLQDAGLPFEPQAEIPKVGRFDGRISPHVFVEIDGAQHDEGWTGDTESSFERDHAKDLGLALIGARSIRITYEMFANRWDDCLEAIRVAVALDVGRARARASTKLRR